jgi:tetratricopeptide (TPR) repeat protein
MMCIALMFTLLCGTPRSSNAVSSGAALEEEKRAAQKMFEAGDGLYESGKYAEAITAFKNSHDLVASPNSRLMLARSLREAGRHPEAIAEFQATIRDAEASFGRYPEALQAAQSELKALEALTAAPPTPLPVEAEQKAEPVPPTVSPAPAPPQAPTATPQPSPTPVNERKSPLTPAAWVSAGIGAAGLATFGIFGYLNHQTYSDLQASCRSVCPADSGERIDAGRRYQLLGNIGLGVAVVGAATATTLFVLSAKRGHEAPPVAVRLSATGLSINGGF